MVDMGEEGLAVGSCSCSCFAGKARKSVMPPVRELGPDYIAREECSWSYLGLIGRTG